MNKSILEQVITIVGDVFTWVPENKINERSNFFEDFSADSLDQIEVIMDAEDTFGISISEEESAAVMTVGDLVKLVEQKTEANK